ncbi:hypothetical protein LB534_08965 [Mesorhizobium sp. CA18]|uniref:hypothetical protein n=1 Tax=unclassified Mesorhizobium TaxID=325217 RepID=UPI001CCF2237|nr:MULTISPECIES: hypothetical protein [unclassified Mesorhizobium]MBZ9733740.1 hypothetical protein [Mesorhizobium sp. CA9]MBZ9825413.1 hypothetical protein [Mesorhizobium sp. CA18]MBZ9834425.1 hypothetical protein [Mesorhizobium sp. CA2]MBZ9836837.1 hypothetical protein [Mesorhizobium sp. CA3]MBZ9875255.1 hypothetical protein [Mesorhizobium sp. Ca11]
MLLPARTAFAGLMALLMLALLGFAQAEISASAASFSCGSSISAARQGDTIALLRTTGKAQALEVRASRPLATKLVGGNSGALAHASDFLVIGRALPFQDERHARIGKRYRFAHQPTARAAGRVRP